MNDSLGRALIVIGLALAALGALLLLGPRVPFLGKLPGDLSYEGKNVRIYFPLATSILLSLALTGIFALVSWLRKK